MKQTPILFSTPMVQAILEGKKTQTRRIIKPQPNFDSAWKNHGTKDFPEINLSGSLLGVSIEESGTGCCVPNVKVKVHKNDIFWVRETFLKVPDSEYAYKASINLADEKIRQEYISQGQDWPKWKPSIFMPKDACRLFLKVTNVRVERLQDITRSDAKAEGIKFSNLRTFPDYRNYLIPESEKFHIKFPYLNPIKSFQSLWQSINGQESWDSNPFVWVYDFERVERPENFA